MLVMEHVTKRYTASLDLLGRVRSRISAVEDVSLDVVRGETLAVVGESGSGKSTVARMLLRLVRPTSGRITLDGIDLATTDREQSRELHRRIQIVFQDPYSSLDPRQRLGAIVTEGLYHSGLSDGEKRVRVAALLRQVGLSENLLTNYPHQLSGGQRQRVGIARALRADPELLVAHEPVSALDGSIQGQVLNLLKALQRDRGVTMVFITHDLSVARYMADRIVVMHLGKVVESAPTERLFEAPVHPYTQALLSAVPRYGRRDRARIILMGDVPSPIDPPPTCRFAGRCPWKTARCEQEDPTLLPEVGADHLVAWFNWRSTPGAQSGAATLDPEPVA